MTTAHEHTKAVVETRDFLRTLASPANTASVGDLQSIAERRPRRFSLNVELAVSAAALPILWPEPGEEHAPRQQARANPATSRIRVMQ